MYCRWQTPPLRDTMDVWGRWAGRGIVMVWEKRRCDVAEIEEKVESSSYQHQHYHQPLRTQWLDYLRTQWLDYLRAHASCVSCACSAWLLLHQHHHQHTLITLTLFVLTFALKSRCLWRKYVTISTSPSLLVRLSTPFSHTSVISEQRLDFILSLVTKSMHSSSSLFHTSFSVPASLRVVHLFDVLILCKSCLTSFDYDQWLKMVKESQGESKRVKESQRESKRVKEVKESQQTEGKSWITKISLHSFS